MQEEYFIYFLELLRILEKSELARGKIDDALIALMDTYENKMTDEQKSLLLKEFIDYEEKREQKREEQRKQLETEAQTKTEPSPDFF